MRVNVLIDSHGWIEYFVQGPLASKYSKYIETANKSEYITPSIVVYEVYKRIKSQKGEEIALRALAHIIEHTTIISVDKRAALDAAEISLKTKLAMADALIKAIGEENNAKIVTGDKHFKEFPDVIFIE